MKNHKIETCICCICKAKRGETFGINNNFYGKKHTKKAKRKIGSIRKKYIGELGSNYIDGRSFKIHYCIDSCNKIVSRKGNRCKSCAKIGKNNSQFGIRKFGKDSGNYKDGKCSLYSSIKGLSEYKQWRKEVYKRDNYICKKCNSDKGGNLESHHIKEFAIILQEFLQYYSQFSPIEDKETLVRLAITYEPFWDINNGETLCNKCHKLTNNYGEKAKIKTSIINKGEK